MWTSLNPLWSQQEWLGLDEKESRVNRDFFLVQCCARGGTVRTFKNWERLWCRTRKALGKEKQVSSQDKLVKSCKISRDKFEEFWELLQTKPSGWLHLTPAGNHKAMHFTDSQQHLSQLLHLVSVRVIFGGLQHQRRHKNQNHPNNTIWENEFVLSEAAAVAETTWHCKTWKSSYHTRLRRSLAEQRVGLFVFVACKTTVHFVEMIHKEATVSSEAAQELWAPWNQLINWLNKNMCSSAWRTFLLLYFHRFLFKQRTLSHAKTLTWTCFLVPMTITSTTFSRKTKKMTE